jgi:rhomboid-like protein
MLRTGARSVASTLPKRFPPTTPLQPFSCAGLQRRRQSTIPQSSTLGSAPRLRSRDRSFLHHGGLRDQHRTFFSPAIIRNYEDLPRDYRDKAGLQFGKKDLSEAEVQRLFGPGIKATSANHLLRILHGRRVAGTLDDPAFAVHTRQFSDDQINKALEYLRKTVSVDEVMNAGLRAEDELNELEAKQAPRDKQKDEAEEVEEEKEPEPEPDSVYGNGVFDKIRARNIAKNVAKEKALKAAEEEKRLKAEAEGRTGPKSLVEVDEGQRAITNPKIAEYYKEATSDLKEAPDMTLWQRIAPSAVLVTLALGFCASVSMVYQEPSERYRLFSDVSIETATLGAIVAANLFVFVGWRTPPLWKFWNKYMLLVVGMPRPISLFTSMFSHKQFGHLLFNMVPLCLVGVYLHEDLGRATFVSLYLACGSIGFLGSLFTYAARGMTHVTTLGASGATLGLLAAWFWDHRDEGFKIMGLPEHGVHGIVYWGLLVALHLAGAGSMFSAKDKIDLVSHLFGIVAGTLGIELINWCGMGREKKKKASDADAAKVKDIVTGTEEVTITPKQAR